MSRAPIRIGRKKLPKIVGTAGITTRNTMMMPCTVKRVLYVRGSTMVGPGAINSRRITSPSTTPTAKNAVMAARYRMPIRL